MKIVFISTVYANALELSKHKVRASATGDDLLCKLRMRDLSAVANIASAFYELFNQKAKMLNAGFEGVPRMFPLCCNPVLIAKDNSDALSIVAKEITGIFGIRCEGVEIASTADGCIFIWPSTGECKEHNVLLEMARELGYSKGTNAMLASPLWC